MHRIWLSLASLITLATPVLAADPDTPLLYKVEHGVNVWAPQPKPAQATHPAPVVVTRQVQVELHLVNLPESQPDSYTTGPRWIAYMGDYPARFPF